MAAVLLYGATGALHDAVTGVPGDFDRCIAAIERAPDATVLTGVTRSNARHLNALVGCLSARGVRTWTLRWPGPTPEGSGPPRLALVVPRMLHTAVAAARTGLTTRLVGVPPCLLGPHAHLTAPIEPLEAPEPAEPSWHCDTCPAARTCSGVPGSYATWYARDLELRNASPRRA